MALAVKRLRVSSPAPISSSEVGFEFEFEVRVLRSYYIFSGGDRSLRWPAAPGLLGGKGNSSLLSWIKKSELELDIEPTVQLRPPRRHHHLSIMEFVVPIVIVNDVGDDYGTNRTARCSTPETHASCSSLHRSNNDT